MYTGAVCGHPFFQPTTCRRPAIVQALPPHPAPPPPPPAPPRLPQAASEEDMDTPLKQKLDEFGGQLANVSVVIRQTNTRPRLFRGTPWLQSSFLAQAQ